MLFGAQCDKRTRSQAARAGSSLRRNRSDNDDSSCTTAMVCPMGYTATSLGHETVEKAIHIEPGKATDTIKCGSDANATGHGSVTNQQDQRKGNDHKAKQPKVAMQSNAAAQPTCPTTGTAIRADQPLELIKNICSTTLLGCHICIQGNAQQETSNHHLI